MKVSNPRSAARQGRKPSLCPFVGNFTQFFKKNLFLSLLFVAGGLFAQPEAFITTWKTDNPGTSNSTSITIPTDGANVYNYSVDWDNDGIYDQTGIMGDVTHDFGTAGVKTIRISGLFPAIVFRNTGDRLKLLDINQWGTNPWKHFGLAYQGCANLNISATDVPDLTAVTTFYETFLGCTALNGPANIGSWDMSSVQDMTRMFFGATSFNQPIGGWDVENVTNMDGLFRGAQSFNQPIGDWKTGNVTNFFGMFAGASDFDQPLNAWNTEKAKNMNSMFENAVSFDQPIGDWNTAEVTNMGNMFLNAVLFDQPIDSWNTAKVKNMSRMFRGASAFNQPIGTWSTEKVENMSEMFRNALSFDQPIGNWDVAKVTDMAGMFAGTTAFNQPLGNWNTAMVSNLNDMFQFATAFNQNIGAWTLNPSVTMSFMLDNSGIDCENYTATLLGWSANPLTPSGRSLYAVGRKYATAAVAARDNLDVAKNWTFTGDALVSTVFYADTDGDGFGDAAAPQNACAAGNGLVASSTDCDDTDDDIFPGNPEVCDGKDNDCNGTIDDVTTCGSPAGTRTWTGLVNTDWHTPCNWNPSCVPTADDDVIIADVTNEPTISTAAFAKSVIVNTGGVLTIAAASSLTVNGSTSFEGSTAAFGNNGTIDNNGTLTIGSINSPGAYGLHNRSVFNNNAGGQINIDRAGNVGLFNQLGTFNNTATIAIGAVSVAATMDQGLWNEATFNNNPGGQINIDRTSDAGLNNSIGGIFANGATITIGAVASVGNYGIKNYTTFNNNACGQIYTFYPLYNVSSFSNAGLLRVNTASAHTNSGTLTNNGIIEYPQGNPIPNVVNNEVIAAPISGGCTVSPALSLGSTVDFTIASNWFLNENLTMPAGTFNQATNTFSNTNVPPGVATMVYLSINDASGGCTRTVSIKITINSAPEICNGLDDDCDGMVDEGGVCCTAPSFTACPSSLTVNSPANGCAQTVAYPVSTSGTAPALTYAFSGATPGSGNGTGSGSAFNLGTTTVVLTATNACGAASCSFTVTVRDLTAPAITCPANIIRNNDAGLCSAVVTYTTPTASDNCGTATVMLLTPANTASGSAFPSGPATTVTWQASDGASPANTATCSFTVKVNDTQAPTITCPANQIRPTGANDCAALVTYNNATATDNCALPTGQPTWVSGGTGTVQGASTTTATFPKGTTTVTWRATDGAGLTKTCTFRVIVNDTQAPSLTCPAPINLNTAPNVCSAVVTYNNPTYTDNCAPMSGTAVRISGTPSGSDFPVGANNVVFQATDAAGNTRRCTLTVTVADNQPPVISCPGPISMAGSGTPCTATVIYNTPTATDNCAGALSPFLLSGLSSGSVFPAGVTTNTWRAVASNGQTVECSFAITVNCPMLRGPSGAQDRAHLALDWSIAPNPAQTSVAIALGSDALAVQVDIYDALGRLVWQQPLGEGQTQLTVKDLASWPSGLYIVALRTADGRVSAKQLVVE